MRQATIAECFSHIGRGKSPQYVEHDGIKVINQACIYWDGIDYKKIKRHDPNKAFHKALVKNQDLLMNSTGTGTLGRAAVHQATDDDEYIADSHVTIMRPHKDVNPFYFAYYFSYPPIQERLYRECVSGSTNQIELSKDKLLSFQVYLPNFATQNSLVQILDKVQTLISLRKQQIAKLDELVKARFVEIFGDPKDNRFNWDTVSLGSLFSVGSSKRIYQNEQVPQGIPFLRISDLMERIEHGIDTAELFISKEKFDKLQQDGLVPKCGDILVTSRGTLGRCYEIKSDDQFYFQDGMISWLSERSDRVNNTYIMNLFSMPGFRKQIDDVPAGSTVNYLSLARLKSLQVMCPPIDLQHQFAAFVAQTDQQKLTIQHSLAQLELLKKALMQKYFG